MICDSCVPNLISVAWLEVCQEPHILEVHSWRMFMVPDWILGGWGHSWHQGSSWYVILELCTKFQLSSMNRSVSRTPRPRSHTWRTLRVPDWRLGGWGRPRRVGSSWETPRNVSWKFGEDLTPFGWAIRVWKNVTENVTDKGTDTAQLNFNIDRNHPIEGGSKGVFWEITIISVSFPSLTLLHWIYRYM